MPSFASDRSRTPATATGAGQERPVRFKARCPRCQKPVRLGTAEISQLGVRLHSQVLCPGCQHHFTLSLTPHAPPPDPPDRSARAMPDDFPAEVPAAPQGPRKAKPPFRPLVDANPDTPPEAPAARERPRTAPFAPLSEDVPAAPSHASDSPGQAGKWPPGRWWKSLPDRQQKMALAAVIGLFAIAVLGWTALQSAPAPTPAATAPQAAKQAAPARKLAADTGKERPAPVQQPLTVEDDLPAPAAADSEPDPGPLVLPPLQQPKGSPKANQIPLVGTGVLPRGS
jgi:hypothetical protein